MAKAPFAKGRGLQIFILFIHLGLMMCLGQTEELQVVPQLLYTEISTCVDMYNYICEDVGCTRDTPLVSREGTKTSRLHTQFPS